MSQFDELNEQSELFPESTDSAPVESSPVESVSDETVSDEVVSDETASDEVVSDETASDEVVSDETVSDEAAESAPEDAEAETPAEECPSPVKPYHKSYYLLFGEDEVPAGIAPDKTLDFLNSIRYDGGELRQARKAKDGSSVIRDVYEGGDECCSYCGVPITGVDYYRLPDGRKRCTRCTRSLVKSLEDLEKILKEVRTNLEMFFGANIDVPIRVEMLDEKKLKKKIRKSISAPSDKSVVLGLAVEKKGEYTVYLENGAPRVSVIETLAHELTHIWQYTHWDTKKMRAKGSYSLEMVEGMAVWVMIQYLYHIGEEAAAQREKAMSEKRKDPYGTGFLRYLQEYPISTKPMVFLDTPFDGGTDPLRQG